MLIIQKKPEQYCKAITLQLKISLNKKGFPCGSAGKESACKRPRFDTWVGKTPWRRKRLPTPVFWPGEFHGLYSPWGHKEVDVAKQLSLSFPSNKKKQTMTKKKKKKSLLKKIQDFPWNVAFLLGYHRTLHETSIFMDVLGAANL